MSQSQPGVGLHTGSKIEFILGLKAKLYLIAILGQFEISEIRKEPVSKVSSLLFGYEEHGDCDSSVGTPIHRRFYSYT